jgi:Ca-activated chloride channel homolog
MKQYSFARWIVVFVLFAGGIAAPFSPMHAQSGRKRPATETRPRVINPNDKTQEKDSSDKPLTVTTPTEVDENGVIKLDTFLVTIPVSVSDRYGKFVPFLVKRDFHVFENLVEQDIESVESVATPFHVALVLDTSNSTAFKLEDIQDAAVAFTNELRPDDQVMVVSFDDRVRVESEFTSDRGQLRAAIYRTRTGGSTKLYDAVQMTLADRLARVQGRKAVVLFTDGVDTSSRRASARSTLDLVEESDTLVFPIGYDTEDSMQGGGVYSPGRTPPVYNPWPNPRGRGRWPLSQLVGPQWPQWPQGRIPQGRGNSGNEYERASRYLEDLADRSGGRLYRADTLRDVSQAFSLIAEELRYQYRINYYPSNSNKDGTYRKIKVRIDKPDLVVRARNGYKAAADSQAKSDPAQDTKRPELKKRPFADSQ